MPGARSALFTRNAAKPLPTLVTTSRYTNSNTPSIPANGSVTITGSPIAVNGRELILIKTTGGSSTIIPTAVTFAMGSGAAGPAPLNCIQVSQSSYCPLLFASSLLTAGGTITPTITLNNNTTSAISAGSTVDTLIERWVNAKIDPSPAISTLFAASGTSMSNLITPTSPFSIISWLAADYTATNPMGTIVLLNNAQPTMSTFTSSGILSDFPSYQPAAAMTAQTFGLTSGSVAQKDTLGAVEIKPIAA